jgi:hypothetical protein
MAEQQFPPARFYGVRTYIDPHDRFRFRYPTGWHEYPLDDNRDGIMYSPEAENPTTWFTVWSSRLEEAVVAEDFDDLRAGVAEGLALLPECHVESASDQVLENLIKFERIYTFRDGDATRKRKVWLLYVDRWLIVLTWQGGSLAAYDHWFPMGNYSFNSFTLPEALWFAVDRDLSGTPTTSQRATSQ